MSKERTRRVLVLLVVLVSVSVIAAPALATPTGTTATTGIDDTLSGDDGSTSDDGSTTNDTNSSDDSTSDNSTSDDGSTTDDTNSSDDSTSANHSASATNDSNSTSDDWESNHSDAHSGADNSSEGNATAARLNLTESVNETLASANETFALAERRVLAGAPSGLSVDSLSSLGSNGTGPNATDPVPGTDGGGDGLLDSTTSSADGLLEATVTSVLGTVNGDDGGSPDAGGAQQSRDAAGDSGSAFLAANVPGGGDAGGAPTGPTAGLALGVGAVAAAAVTRHGALFPGLTAEVGATAMSALAVPARVRNGLDRLLRTVAPFRYSRYDDSDPLEHEARADVFSVVEESPGAYLSELAERADVPLSTARHHVRVLEREDLVSGAKVRGKRRFYPAYETDVEISAAMNDDATAAVLDALARLGASSVSALADEVGRDPSTVTHHLQRLEEDDIVVREREGRSVVNKLSPEARTALEPETGEAERAEAPEALASD